MYSDDDSDFYGDDSTVADLKARVHEYDVQAFWRKHKTLKTPLKLQALKQVQADVSHLYNPYAGVSYAWQLTESVDDFLERLPPATTDETPGTPWVWICNPYVDRKPKKQAHNQKLRGCEDEGLEEEGTDLLRFVEGGMERLHFASEFIDDFKTSGKAKGLITRETNKAGADAARDVLDLAQNLQVRCGKWILFCDTHTVNDVWSIIAKATANNELGIGAKVAPRTSIEPRTNRLICVYTADFGDVEDVNRVALKLKQLGLIQTRGKPLYYKPGQLISVFPPWIAAAGIEGHVINCAGLHLAVHWTE